MGQDYSKPLSDKEYAELVKMKADFKASYDANPKAVTEAFYECFGHYAPKSGDLND